jgi:hypothetical protein
MVEKGKNSGLFSVGGRGEGRVGVAVPASLWKERPGAITSCRRISKRKQRVRTSLDSNRTWEMQTRETGVSGKRKSSDETGGLDCWSRRRRVVTICAMYEVGTG